MKKYETIFIVNPNVSAEEIENHIKKVSNIIQENCGEIEVIERWGLRRLAYLVKKFNRGSYIFMKIKSDNKILNELQRYYLINDTIIKFIIVQEKIHRLKGKKSKKGVLPPVKIEVGSDIITHPEDELA